ncbi:MAG: uncharacterized protein JWM85_733 [Acidimicrobiaceae bacterium]|nr:uncharacterized protein [Acidimicrobiaceae bacterium]
MSELRAPAGGPLTLKDVLDLRAYERQRDDFRREVIAAKRLRRVRLGPLLSAVFENRLTVRFQVQEMVRAERMISDEQVQGELDAYNPLLPGPGELSLTLFLELTSEEELREWLPKLVGIERSLVLRVGTGDEALEVRGEVEAGHASQLTRDEVTASVHYVRIPLTAEGRTRFLGDPVTLVADHPAYRHEVVLRPETRASLVADWD